MTKVRRVDWYPDEWLSGTAGLTPEQRGVYDTVLMLIYSAGTALDMPEKELAHRCKCDPRTLRRIIESLESLGKLRCNSAGHLTNGRAEDELKKARSRIEKNQENGRSGGRPSKEINDLPKPNGSGDENLNYQLPTTNQQPAPAGTAPPSPEIAIIKAFDDAIAEAYGENLRRAWPNQFDRQRAGELVARGAGAELVRVVTLGICERRKAQGKSPPDAVGYIAKAVLDAQADASHRIAKPLSPNSPDGQWRMRVAVFKAEGYWRPEWGPKPGEPGCIVPKSLTDPAA